MNESRFFASKFELLGRAVGGLSVALFLLSGSGALADDEVCWRETEGRGVGTIPRECDLVEELKAFTCYEQCRPGYTGLVAKCRMDCPEGFEEGVLNYCVKSESYRVEGFGWQAGDGVGANRLANAEKRCEARHGAGRCVQRQLAFYPRCKPGFAPEGINICSQSCPAGWEASGNRCLRPSYVRAKSKPECGPGKEFGAGLCRDECPAGYGGVGPVCWADCPAAFPAKCGMACATSDVACAGAIIDQVMSVVEVVAQVAAMVVTGGASSAATTASGAAATGGEAAAKAAAKSGAKAALRRAGKEIAKFSKAQLRDVLEDSITDPVLLHDTVEAVYAVSQGELEDGSPGEKALEVFAAIDPTGISGIVAAYKKPICPLN